jgi:hypothetical protein
MQTYHHGACVSVHDWLPPFMPRRYPRPNAAESSGLPSAAVNGTGQYAGGGWTVRRDARPCPARVTPSGPTS